MKDRNENTPGYKKIKVGWIPEEWKCIPLEKLAIIQTGLAKNRKHLRKPVSLPYLRVANVQDGFLDLKEIKESTLEKDDVERYLLQSEDVLFTEGGDFDKLGRGSIWRDEIVPCLHQNHIFAVRCNKARLLPFFLSAVASGPYGRRYFVLSSKQSTNLASINSTQLKAFVIPLPPLQEQKKIAEILSTWDEAIEQTRKLFETKKNRKKALMQQLLIGERRLRNFGSPRRANSRFPSDWECLRAQDLFQVRSIKGCGNESVLSVTQDKGVVPRDTLDRRIEASEANTDLLNTSSM